ncbi:hypothetical protein ACFQH2_02320 [Natronoarchaeum sp. GCM10025703]|uniref:hypothetical protein n=1 Tax=Natronoarchaeum sp. GCM10025703 TaxID=3252685 RepID=UPI00361C0404
MTGQLAGVSPDERARADRRIDRTEKPPLERSVQRCELPSGVVGLKMVDERDGRSRFREMAVLPPQRGVTETVLNEDVDGAVQFRADRRGNTVEDPR